jgi:hypothetical protein
MSMRWRASSETAVWMITSATLQAAAGTQYAVERRLLVGHEVDHAVGDHGVDARVVDRERLDQSLVRLDARSPIPHALEAARSNIARVTSTPIARPSAPVICAATSRSVPAGTGVVHDRARARSSERPVPPGPAPRQPPGRHPYR